jgi:murein DD-endopeptidase MepM/ murein hydrolase activator NlpD
MKKLLKNFKNKFGKGLTLLIIPSNGAAIKGVRLSLSIGIVIISVIILNIYLVINYSSQIGRVRYYEKIVQQKNSQIGSLQKGQKQLGQTLAKSYQITEELNKLKQERLKNLELWKNIQGRAKIKRPVSRSRKNIGEITYCLPDYQQEPIGEVHTLVEQNLNRIQKFIELEQQKQVTFWDEIKYYQKKLEYIPSLNPLRYGRITSWFGTRIHPKLGFSRFHSGIDLAATVGTKVYATAAGKVIFAGYKSGYGITVILEHKYIYKTVYGHNSKLLVKKGQQVKKGQVICLSGNTGTSTGPHLHYEVRINNQPVNPIMFLKN